MTGWLTNGFQNLATFYGGEKLPLDTNLSGGIQPMSAKVSFQSLATAFLLFTTRANKTTVSGTRYYSSIDVNAPSYTAADGGATQASPVALITGVQVLIGGTGGTDNWLVELHDSTGVLVATSATAGVLVSTAGTWQQIPFTSTVSLVPGTYFIVVQSNGTTATPAVYNYPAPATTFLVTGSATGVFGTGANFTPATTYTANVGPVALLY